MLQLCMNLVFYLFDFIVFDVFTLSFVFHITEYNEIKLHLGWAYVVSVYSVFIQFMGWL